MTTENAIVTFQETQAIAAAAIKSRFYTKLANSEQAIVKILRGREFGLQPMESLESVYVVNDKTALTAGVIAAKIKSSGKYDYAIKTLTDKVCILEFSANGKPVGESQFTMADAETAGLLRNATYKNYPRNMLFNRALTNGARWYTPDVFGGAIYTPDELKMVVTDAEDEPEPPVLHVTETETIDDAEIVEQEQTEPPALATKKQLQTLGILCAEKIPADVNIHKSISKFLELNTPIASRTELTESQADKVIEHLRSRPNVKKEAA